jgi:pimeloyl-ACP methyl ester carboxylesterase
MRQLLGSGVVVLIVILGVAVVLGTGYALAPEAPSLAPLWLVPLITGLAIVTLLMRPVARRMSWRPGRAIGVAVLLTLAPFAALAFWAATAPLPMLAPPVPDPRGAPTMLSLPTGSRLATWSLPGEGERRRTPVLFLHGGPGYYVKPRDLEMGAAFRRAGFDTIYHDQAGSGASGDLPAANYTVARQVADVEALRKHLGAEQVVLWGESWGAVLAARYALAHPDRVAGAVFASPGEYPGQPEVEFDYSGVMPSPEPSRPPQMMILYLLLTRAPQLAESWMDQQTARRVSSAIQVTELKSPGPRCLGSTWDQRARQRIAESSVYTLRRVLLDGFAQPAPPPRRFEVPALIMRGECDFIPISAARYYAAAYPGARILNVQGAGHSLLDHEAEFEKAAEAFAHTELSDLP